MANSILWKDISSEEIGELLLTTDVQECKNRLYDNLSLSYLFYSPVDYNKCPENVSTETHVEEVGTNTNTSNENKVEEKDKMWSPTRPEPEKETQAHDRAAIVVDIFFYVFSFCKENRWTPNKISTLLSIMRTLFIKDMNIEEKERESNKDKPGKKTADEDEEYFSLSGNMTSLEKDDPDLISQDRSMEVSFQEFKNMLLYHSVERPPISAGIFEENDIDNIVQYILDSYYRHYRLFKYIFTPQPLLFLEQGSMNNIDKIDPPPPLSEGIIVKNLTEIETSASDEKKNE